MRWSNMKDNEYYRRGYELGIKRGQAPDSKQLTDQVSEMVDKLIYQHESFKSFSIGFIYGFNETQKGDNHDK